MRTLSTLVLAAVATIAGCAVSDETEETAEDAESLVGGERATSSMFASTFFLDWSCTAAKVGPRHVLTAAHCVQDLDRNGAVMPAYWPNHGILLTTKKKLDGRKGDAAAGFVEVVVERTHMHPTWRAEWPNRQGDAVVRSPNAPADVAVIVLTPASARAIASVPVAKVDLSPLRPGDGVTLNGYGCRHGVNVDEGGFIDVLKYSREAVIPKEALLHPGGYFTGPGDPVLANVDGSYAFTPGKRMQPKDASLCPGDSGGPLYRLNGRADTIVGVNAYYDFAPEAEDPKHVSITNWHTRLDENARNGVATWLVQLGVSTTRTR